MNAVVAPETIVQIPLDQLRESPFNPRKTFTDIEQLAQDIQSIGRVLQPLLVRPVLANVLHPNGPVDHYEVVFGHRRLRAAKLAGLATAPCMVREMSPEEMKRAQISENLSRADVHPMEEAEGFQVLMRDHGISADDLAAQLGKSKSHVYGRLKLLQACPLVREACVKGEILPTVALLIARLRTEKLQEKALKYIEGKYLKLEDGGKKSFREIRDLLLERFTLELKGAIFDVVDAQLLPEAGTCTDCPKRSGNAPEFQDVTDGQKSYEWSRTPIGADVCTDPDCWDAKKTAHLKREAAALVKDGRTVVTGNAARVAVGADGIVKGAYIALKDVKKELKAKGEKPETLLIQDQRTGEVIEAVRRTDCQQAGLAVAAKASQQDLYEARRREEAEKETKAKEKAAKLTQQRMDLLVSVRDAMSDTPITEFDMRMIAAAALRSVGYQDKAVLLQAWGVKSVEELTQRIPAMTLAEATLLARDCALVVDLVVSHYEAHRPDPAKNLQAAAERFGLVTSKPAKPKTKKAAAEPVAEESHAR
jgi:ParB/RepB/Spo0J family partition protein